MLSKHPCGHRGRKHRGEKTAVGTTQLRHKVLHLLGGVSIPGVVVLLAVLLRPQSADIPILLEFFGPLLHSLRGLFFSEQMEEKWATLLDVQHLTLTLTLRLRHTLCFTLLITRRDTCGWRTGTRTTQQNVSPLGFVGAQVGVRVGLGVVLTCWSRFSRGWACKYKGAEESPDGK